MLFGFTIPYKIKKENKIKNKYFIVFFYSSFSTNSLCSFSSLSIRSGIWFCYLLCFEIFSPMHLPSLLHILLPSPPLALWFCHTPLLYSFLFFLRLMLFPLNSSTSFFLPLSSRLLCIFFSGFCLSLFLF